MRFSLRRRKLSTFNNLKARRGLPPSCLWWCSVMFDSRRWRIHRVSHSFPPNGKRIIAASLKHCLHWTPSIRLSQPLCAGFSVPTSGEIAYLELHSEVPSNFHNPCSFFVSTWLLCASGQGNLLFICRGKLCSFKMRFKIPFLCNCFLLFMAAFSSFLFFESLLHILTPQVWRNRTQELVFFPSMPLAQNHRATMPTAGWILILALLVAQQVQFVLAKQLFLPKQGSCGSLFQSSSILIFKPSHFGSKVNHLMLGKKIKKENECIFSA